MRYLAAVIVCVMPLAAQSKKYEIRQPKGTWQTPGEIQKPTGPWLVPKNISGVRAQEASCDARLVLNADTLFAFDKADLTPPAETTLQAIGAMVKEKAGAHPVSIEGHTDSVGNDTYNQRLSEDRARAVQQWLVAHQFLSKERTRVEGFGKKRPVVPNSTPDGKDDPEGRQKNRRVEVAIQTCK